MRLSPLHVLAASVVLAISAPAHGRFEPADNPALRGGTVRLVGELEQSNLSAAAQRLERMLREHPGATFAVDDHRLLSLLSWLDTLPQAQRAALSTEFERQQGAAARQMLARAQEEHPDAAAPLLAVAARYPLTRGGAEALHEAALRSLQRGDIRSAAALSEQARQRGHPDEPEAVRTWRDSAGAQKVPPPRPVLFEARWHDNADAVGISRSIPVAAGDLVFIVAERHVVALNQSGEAAWIWRAPQRHRTPLKLERPLDMGRGAVYRPAVLSDHDGTARLVVARQMQSGSDDWCLRAFRAQDGKLLWSTEGRESHDRLRFLSAPALSGAMVYAVALDGGGTASRLLLVALDVMSGEIVWESVLGSGVGVRNRQGDALPVEVFWQQDAPAVDEQHVYVAPLTGVVLAVGRFDGVVRWAHRYPAPPQLPALQEWRRYRELRLRGAQQLDPPMSPMQLLRWSNTPHVDGDAVIFAPADTPAAMALDAHTGRMLWHLAEPPEPLLAGASHDHAVFYGAGISAVSSHTGEAAWSWAPADPRRGLTGPVFVTADGLSALTRGGHLTLSITDGEARSAAAALEFRRILESQPGRRALTEAQVLSSFGPPNR